jgi:hypothetical protein
MRNQQFPVCCSVVLHTHFGNTDAAIDRTNYTKEQVATYLRNNTTYGIHTLVLNEEQDRAIGKVVRKAGFRCVKKTKKNGNHNMKVLFFVKE